MHANGRFAVAVHLLALTFVAEQERLGTLVTSEYMAASVNTNPVVVRRVLGSLREAGLVTSQAGPGGGWQLTRAADEISLRDIYCAVVDAPILALPSRDPNRECPVGGGYARVLSPHFERGRSRVSGEALGMHGR